MAPCIIDNLGYLYQIILEHYNLFFYEYSASFLDFNILLLDNRDLNGLGYGIKKEYNQCR